MVHHPLVSPNSHYCTIIATDLISERLILIKMFKGDQRVVRGKKFQDLLDDRIADMGVEPIERPALLVSSSRMRYCTVNGNATAP